MTQAQLINDERQDDEVSCPRCGSSAGYERCDDCEDGVRDRYEEEPNWYEFAPDSERFATCGMCNGKGGWYRCLSSYDWCQSHPLPGRENVRRAE